MTAFAPAMARTRALAERVDRLSLRERMLVFGAAVAVAYVAWQSLLMDPLAARASAAERRLEEVGQRLQGVDAVLAAGDPRAQALARRRAIGDRLDGLNATLQDAASGYVPSERMTEMLRDVLASQRGLRLVSLRNLPVESLAAAAPAAAGGAAGATGAPESTPATPSAAATDPATSAAEGPFVHPVELVVEGDYAAILQYLQALERLPWRMQWRRLDLAAGEYPSNRVRIEIGTLSLSREWLSV